MAVVLAGIAFARPVALAQPPSAAGAQLVTLDGIAAIVGGAEPGEVQHTILRSDVELRARLALLRRDVTHALLGELPASLLAATLNQLLGEQLIAAEADRVQVAKPHAADIAREKLNLVQEAGGWHAVTQLLARFDVGDAELEEMARRRALISAFLRANLEGATVVTENQIDERLRADAAGSADAQRAKPGEPGFAAPSSDPALRAEARAAISQEALAQNIERWVRVLHARARVRILATFDVP